MTKLTTRAAILAAAILAPGVSQAAAVDSTPPTTLLISSVHAPNGSAEYRAHSYVAGETVGAVSDGGFTRATTALGVNRIAARDTLGFGAEATSLWGENLRLTGNAGDQVKLRFEVTVDGTATALPGAAESEDPPINFSYYLGVNLGRAQGFDALQSDGDFDPIVVGSDGLIGHALLCPAIACGFGSYDKKVTLDLTVDANADLFVYGLLQLTDLHYADFAFEHTARLTGIIVDGDASLVSDSGKLLQAADGSYRFASDAPEPATWATMVAGFGLIGGAMRRRQRVQVRFA